jgi:hypothetical protein
MNNLLAGNSPGGKKETIHWMKIPPVVVFTHAVTSKHKKHEKFPCCCLILTKTFLRNSGNPPPGFQIL